MHVEERNAVERAGVGEGVGVRYRDVEAVDVDVARVPHFHRRGGADVDVHELQAGEAVGIGIEAEDLSAVAGTRGGDVFEKKVFEDRAGAIQCAGG